MSNFHINKKGNCPFGGGEKHFDNKEQAQKFIDKRNEKEYGLLSSNISIEEKRHNKQKKTH